MTLPLLFADRIAAYASTAPLRDVVTFVDIGAGGAFLSRSYTYEDLWRRGSGLAAALAKVGVGPGQTFALMLDNQIEFVDAMIAASLIGAVFVPIDPRTRGAKLAYMLAHADCVGVIAAAAYRGHVDEAREQATGLNWCWVAEGAPDLHWYSYDDVLAGSDVTSLGHADVSPDAPMQIVYTSGTTADPKAILMPHRRFAEITAGGAAFGLRAGDRPYTGLSFTHVNAQILTLGASLAMNLRCVISRRFTKSRFWDVISTFGCTSFNLLGGMATALLAEPQRDDDAANPARFALSAGMPRAIWTEFSRRFGVEIFEFYGTAEGGFTFNPPGAGPVGSCGRPPASLNMTIRDENDQELPPGEAGEICFRPADGTAPPVVYYRNPEASAAKTRGGWLRTGDIGSVDADGWLTFHYRRGGGIRRNGDFIIPQYVEHVVGSFPEVADVFVYGVPANSGAPGESDIVAAVVVADGILNLADLCSHVAKTVERNCLPTWLQIVPEIPKTASEKPIERVLREAFDRGEGLLRFSAAGDRADLRSTAL